MQISDALLRRPGDLPTPGAQTSAKPIRPVVCGLEDDAAALPAHQDFAPSRKPALLRESATAWLPPFWKSFVREAFMLAV